jgi:RNA polymerase sigma-70 factor (ECF subfamily)
VNTDPTWERRAVQPPTPEPEELLRLAAAGDAAACQHLLSSYRERLRRMVAVRMDSRIGARVDPSDVVQEALFEAYDKLPDYLTARPLPFYPWLRQIALDRITDLHRRHLHAQKRSVSREECPVLTLPEESVLELASRLVLSGSSPSQRVQREELRLRVRQALLALNERDREVLVLRYLEQMSMADIAALLGITEGAAKVRHLRALERIRSVMGEIAPEEKP